MGLISKSYRAFTLWETIIAIIITSTIVSLSYGSYRLISDMLFADEKNLDEMHESLLLERELMVLLESCQSMELLGDVIWFNGLPEEISLEFLDSTMLIYGLRPDEELEIGMLSWSVEHLNEDSDFLRSFHLDYRMERQAYHLSFIKHYPKRFQLGLQ